MDLNAALAEIDDFLCCPTPDAWLQQVPMHLPELLIDHANCEKKAASTALSLTYRYQLPIPALQALSKLGREELRHFEQVLAILKDLDIEYRPLSASDYAGHLRAALSTTEPLRLVDTLLVCAIVEARSCERFNRLLTVLDEPLRGFYGKLLSSEARHYRLYLDLARAQVRGFDIGQACYDQRLQAILAADREAVNGVSGSFRFHSGVCS